MADSQNTRLDRIEGKIDKLHEGFVSLARMEEKFISQFKTNEQVEGQLKQMRIDINKRFENAAKVAEKQSEKIFVNSQITSKVNKLFWLVVFGIPTGLMGLAFFMVRP